jgi:signal transduction histidine kinase
MDVLFEPNFVKSLGGRGTGIELNICQEIVRQHSGQICAESSPEAGTTFQVCLPVEVTVG